MNVLNIYGVLNSVERPALQFLLVDFDDFPVNEGGGRECVETCCLFIKLVYYNIYFKYMYLYYSGSPQSSCEKDKATIVTIVR